LGDGPTNGNGNGGGNIPLRVLIFAATLGSVVITILYVSDVKLEALRREFQANLDRIEAASKARHDDLSKRIDYGETARKDLDVALQRETRDLVEGARRERIAEIGSLWRAIDGGKGPK
jgi:hypothetical protein